MIEVEGPDGTVVEFPDGTAPDIMAKAMQNHYGAQPAPAAAPAADAPTATAPVAAEQAAAPTPNDDRSGVRKVFDAIFPKYGLAASVANGAAFGTLPNIQAGVAAGVQGLYNALGADGPSMGETYDQKLAQQQGARHGFEAAAPFTNAVGGAIGGAGTGLGLARAGVTLTGNIASRGLSNIGTRTLAGVGEGAAYGAASGFGGGEGGFENRARGAIQNAPLGAAVGGAAPALGALLGAATPVATGWYTAMHDPVRRGDEILVRSIMRDRTTPEALAQSVEAAGAAGQGEYVAVDAAGKNFQRTTAMAAKTPGPFRDEVAQRMAARQDGQGERIGGYVNERLGAVGPDAFQTEQGIAAGRKAASQQLYDEAYRGPTPAGDFYTQTLGRQSVRDSLPAVRRVAEEQQMPISNVFTEVPNPNPTTRQVPSGVLGPDGQPIMRAEVENPTIEVPTMRGWDMVKRELDARVDQAYRAGDTTAGGAMKETRNQLRDQLGQDNPAYGRALQRYSSDAEALDAIQTGRDVIRSANSDEATAALRQVPENQLDLPRIGAAREIRAKMDPMDPGRDKTRLFNTPKMRSDLNSLSDDPVAQTVFESRMGRERDMVRSNRAVQGGSTTFENASDDIDLGNTGGALAALFTGHLGRAAGLTLGNALTGARRMGAGMSEGAAQRVGEYALANDPGRIRMLNEMFAAAQARAEAPSLVPSVLSSSFNAPRTGNGRERR